MGVKFGGKTIFGVKPQGSFYDFRKKGFEEDLQRTAGIGSNLLF
jgi:hypothetical protein